MKISLFMPLTALALVACASTSGNEFPSLARRPIENPRPDANPTPSGPIAADAALTARIAGLLEDARKGDAAFQAAADSAQKKVSTAAHAAAGSEAWIDAQQAVSGVDATRGLSADALAQLDSLLVERLDAIAGGKAQGGEAELRAASAEVGAIVEKQNRLFDRLKGALRQ